MTSAVPSSASLTNSTPGAPHEGRASLGYDASCGLMDAALERISAARTRRGRVHLDGVKPAVEIIVELRAALDLDRGGPVAVNVDDLYDYMCRRLRSAGSPNGLAALDEVSHLLHALRSAWAFLPAAEPWAASGN
jgi:flagellar secretion chaperone FliS